MQGALTGIFLHNTCRTASLWLCFSDIPDWVLYGEEEKERTKGSVESDVMASYRVCEGKCFYIRSLRESREVPPADSETHQTRLKNSTESLALTKWKITRSIDQEDFIRCQSVMFSPMVGTKYYTSWVTEPRLLSGSHETSDRSHLARTLWLH